MNTNTDQAQPLPDDEPTPEELAQAGTIRPLNELPSPWTIKGNPRMISEPTLKVLSSADQEIVVKRAGSAEPEAINKALMEFLRERQREFRIRCGAGPGASETEREALEQMNSLRQLSEEMSRLESDLQDIREHRTDYDADGRAVAVPVYTYQGDLRSAKQYRLNEIRHEMALIAGPQGEAALQRAARKDVMRNRELKAQLEDGREIKRRAYEMAREDRLNEAARQKAKLLRGTQ